VIEDTITAIATPIGTGGIGIIRLSGSNSLAIADKMFNSWNEVKVHEIPSFNLRLGYVIDPGDGEVFDEVLLSVMRAPKSFTGEDVVEINCHGGPIVMEKILRLTLELGARMAEAGEFTKRAFLNGRIDLAQAEAVIDVIEAKTDLALGVAVNQLHGNISERIGYLQKRLVSVLAQMEASIDFPEDVGEIDCSETRRILLNIKETIHSMIAEGQRGKILREGLTTVIIGKPNVGKSSLLNALVKENRAIVTEFPGTTRDAIEEVINLDGLPLRIVDTAGIRETGDVVEKIGVDRAKKLLAEADLVLFVVDAATMLTEDDKLIARELNKDNTIVLLNKHDLKNIEMTERFINETLPEFQSLKISAKEKWGLDKLPILIRDKVFGNNIVAKDRNIVTRSRHLSALNKAVNYLNEAINGLENGNMVDLLTIDIRGAWDSLGEITGETIAEDVLNTIFKEFCIGK